MKKYLLGALIGVCSTVSLVSAKAQVLVQNANFALTAEVQVSDGVVKKFGITSKTLIQYLRGSTNAGTESIITDVTNEMAIVTNSPFLPSNSFPNPFALTNYYLTAGGSTYTNGIQFTNDLELNKTSDDPATYDFPNLVSVTVFGSNVDGVLFPVLPNSSNVIAVLDTTVTNATVFDLFGITRSLIQGDVTNTVPDQFNSKTQRLIVKSTADSQTYNWYIRDGTAKSFVDYDVTTFFNYNQLLEVSQARGTGFSDYLDLSIDFNFGNASGIGTQFGTEANGRQTRGTIPNQSGLWLKSVTATCVGSGTAAAPVFPPAGRALPTGAMTLSGRFSASGGKIEAIQ